MDFEPALFLAVQNEEVGEYAVNGFSCNCVLCGDGHDAYSSRGFSSDEDVMEAARMANCEEFIERLPEKYSTNIGENGSELSGGERQRISIARAFLKDAPVILLDEATASLDAENETAVQEALSRLIKNKTVLIIAHRMRTIANADHIVVLKDGVVAEDGTPEELVRRNGIYKHMCETQRMTAGWKM